MGDLDTETMIAELINNYAEMYHEEPDFDTEAYAAQLDALSEDELLEEYRTHFGSAA